MTQTAKTFKEAERNIRRKKLARKTVLAIVAYSFGIIYFFPILYMFLTGMKTELEAVNPSLFFTPTFETYEKIFNDASMYSYMYNSIFHIVTSTLICLLIGVPASFVIQFGKFKKSTTNDRLHSWFITTILLPPVAILVPVYLIYNRLGLMNDIWGLTILYVGFHTPLVIWMVHSFMTDVPRSLIEASEIDGCTRTQQMIHVAVPLVKMGIFSAGMLAAVFIWNEFLLAFQLTINQTATLSVFMSRFREQQGQFTAQLSASATLCVLPTLLLGWSTQKSLVKGLTMGAVKG
ncbi:MAG: carbohydrate ABC transporter permease [Clostridia bacterium]|nr:carbohydrate ABC transporter permease [Clostridia bacterium]